MISAVEVAGNQNPNPNGYISRPIRARARQVKRPARRQVVGTRWEDAAHLPAYELGGHKKYMDWGRPYSRTKGRIKIFETVYDYLRSHWVPEKVSTNESQKPLSKDVLNFSPAIFFNHFFA